MKLNIIAAGCAALLGVAAFGCLAMDDEVSEHADVVPSDENAAIAASALAEAGRPCSGAEWGRAVMHCADKHPSAIAVTSCEVHANGYIVYNYALPPPTGSDSTPG